MVHISTPGALEDGGVYTSSKNIIQHLLQTLPVAGENYLIVFKLIHDLCLGEVSLTPSDLSLLAKHVELSEKEQVGSSPGVGAGEEAGKEEGGGGKGKADTICWFVWQNKFW